MGSWGYSGALEAAGAKIHDMETFGSWQGTWIAHVTLPDGRSGLIYGYYGSCSGCDAFEAEFGYDIHQYARPHEAEFDPTCETCIEYRKKLMHFGQEYFGDLQTPEEVFKAHFVDRSYWSSYDEDKEQLRFIMTFVEKDSELYQRMQTVLESAKD